MSRIFLSHSSKDNAASVALAEWLKEEGWADVFLDLDPVQGIHPGERWERALYTHAADCEAVLFLVTRNWLASEWCRREFDLARKLNKRCFVIIVENIPIDELPLFLKETNQTVSLAAGGDHRVFKPRLPITQEEGYVTFSAEGLARLKIGLEQAGLDPRFFAWPPANEPDRAPYRGLEPLEAIDAGIFFGRDGPIIEALDVLRGLREATPPRLFVILGASGAGKSSFLRAGLLPRLTRDDRNYCVLPILRPERTAISGPTGFVAAVAEALVNHGQAITRAQVRQATSSGVSALRPILRSLAPVADKQEPATLVLAIDQAEEMFRAEAAEESEELLRLLRELIAVDDPPVLVVFVIRSDSYDALERAKALEGVKQTTFALLPMPHGAYQTVIEGPLKRLRQSGRKFEVDPGLTEALLEDIEKGGGSDALPLLSFTLELLYRDHEAARHISRQDYLDFGGLKGAIDAALKRAFAAADHEPRIPRDYEARLALVRRGFIPWLAGVDPETKSLRRRVARASQIPVEAQPLIDLLVEQRLLTRDIDKASGEATIEPAHEALLRQWGGLKGWLEEDFGRLAALESVKRAAMDWDANLRAEAWLAHGGARLSDADQLDLRQDLSALLNVTDRAYLAACRRKEQVARDAEEAQRRTEADLERAKQEALVQREHAAQRMTRIVAGAGALIAVAGIFAFWQWRIADAQLTAATETANELVHNIAGNAKDMSGVQTKVVLEILDVAHELQEHLTSNGFKNADLQRSHAASQEETVPICLALGNTSCAFKAADEAVSLRKPLAEANPEDPQLGMELAHSLSRMGDVKKAMGDLPAALDTYRQALQLQQKFAPSSANLDWRSEMATSDERIGDVLLAQGDAERAYDSYRRALNARQEIAKADPESPEWRGALSKSEIKAGDALFETDRISADRFYRDGLSHIDRLSKDNPHDPRWRQELSTSLDRLGDIELSLDKWPQALDNYQRSLGIRDELADSDPLNAQRLRERAVSYGKVGDAQMAGGDIEGAAKSYAQGLVEIGTLADADKANSPLQLDLSRSLSKMGDLRLIQGEAAEALDYYKRSLEKLSEHRPADGKDIRWRQDIARLNDFIGTILFNQRNFLGATAAFQGMLSAWEEIAAADHADPQRRLRVVEARKKLAVVDTANAAAHIDAARAILDDLSAKVPAHDYNLRRMVDYGKTQLNNSRIDLYNLVGRHARLARR